MILNSLFLLGGQSAGAKGAIPTEYFMIGALILVFYFFMIRPQAKKAKEQKTFHAGIQKGDKVVTVGGMHGKVSKVNDNTIELEIANNVVITIERSTVSMEYTRALQNPGTKPAGNA